MKSCRINCEYCVVMYMFMVVVYGVWPVAVSYVSTFTHSYSSFHFTLMLVLTVYNLR